MSIEDDIKSPGLEDDLENGVFWHECEEPGCARQVQFDDEPKCFTHSPDEGSSVYGYSAYEQAARKDKED